MGKEYWENFYKDFKVYHPSSFANFCLQHIPRGSSIIDVGCGNGRDTYLFGGYNKVLGIDYATKPDDTEYVKFKKMELKELISKENTFDVVYSRFFFNSITNEEIEEFIKWCSGIVMFECRTTDNTGTKLTYQDHERNIIDGTWLLNLLIANGFDIMLFVKSKNLSIFGEEDPILLRVLAEKIK